MKHLSLLVLFCLFAPATLCAQQLTHKDVKFKYKKGYVFVQKKEVLKLRYSIGYFYVSDLNTGEEMMYFRINDNETPSYFDDDYVKVFFNDSEKEFESKSHQRILMAQMINEGVFDSDWNLVAENVDKFIRKYDENIS
ncbi:MAG: hypothetical protein ACPHYC_04410, partial [Schleiferiaceae bacterium]